jgi:hypothetical protein
VDSTKSVFIWTEAFNCVEILPPFLESFRTHHNLPIHVFTSEKEREKVPRIEGVTVSEVADNWISKLYLTSPKAVARGYKRGHLGTARVWSNIIRSRREEILVHLDADTVFLSECLSELIESISSGYEVAGTRRPYFNRGYRKDGPDGKKLDKHPDVLNTDIIAFQRSAIPRRLSPLLTRRIRGKRPLRYPVIDYFDPIIFEMIRAGRKIGYLDSPDSGDRGFTNPDSRIYKSRISFAAVGSGLNFYKNPEVETSPGYRAYAMASYSLYAKYLLGIDTGLQTLDNPEVENKLKQLDKSTWTLRGAK